MHGNTHESRLRATPGQDARMTEVIADVRTRLRGVCAHLPEAEFRDLVQHIAAIAVKYEALAESAGGENTGR